MRELLHFARRDDTSGLFTQLARRHDADQFHMRLATLEKMDGALRAGVAAQGVGTFDLGARSKDFADYLRAALKLSRYLRRNRVQLLHDHFYYPTIVGGLAGVLARTPGRVMTRHHSDYHVRLSQKPNRHVRLDQLTTRLHHKVIAISHHTREHLVNVEGAPPEKVVTVRNGIDFDDVRITSPEQVARLKEQYGAHKRDLILLVARFSPEKGLEHLYSALQMLRGRTHRPFVVLHAGTGAREPFYREQVARLGLDDVVEFLGFRDDVPDLMAASDLMVLPSTMEAFGLVLAEALYLGLPVVATNVGGVPEIVEEGVSGLLVPHAAPEALANALLRMLNNPEERRAMAGAGRRKIIDDFSFSGMLQGYEQLYRELVVT
jgi:glycosyltransferase involved in cell wall biosynthesis